MKSTFFIAILLITLTAAVFSGCSQKTEGSNPADDTGAAKAGEIKRTELVENAQFVMDLAIEPKAAAAGQDVVLNFAARDREGNLSRNLQIVHEKPVHLLIVSDDLAFFDHVHPEPQADGTFKLSYRFPTGGAYKLYADFTPENSPQIVNVFDVAVGGKEREKTPLAADTDFTKTVDGLTFTMKTGEPLKAGTGTTLNFFVKDAAGKAVTDLQPYLGAMAHFVVISEDTTRFLHVHADEEPAADAAGGHADHNHKHADAKKTQKTGAAGADRPTVTAHTEFPSGGLYKLWAQFQRGGQVFTVPFVLDVAAGDAKPAEKVEVPADAIRINVSGAGYEPSSVSVKKGRPVTLAFFRKDANNCGGELVFPKLNIKKRLPVGETVLVEVTPQESGELEFACGMNMMKGKLVVQ